MGLKKSSAWVVPKQSVIFSNGATIGAISINTYDVTTKQGILGIVPKATVDVISEINGIERIKNLSVKEVSDI